MRGTRGDVEALRDASSRMQAASGRLGGPIDDYREALRRVDVARSDLDVALVDRAARIERIVTTLDAVGAQPAMFAAALLAADRSAAASSVYPGTRVGHVVETELLRRLIADDPVAAHARHQRGEDVASELRELVRDPDDLEAVYERLTTLLQELAAGDELLLAAAFDALGADGLLEVLAAVREAHLLRDAAGSRGARALDPTSDLLAPLTASFERATRLGLLDPDLGDELTARIRAEPDGDWRTHDRVEEELLLLGQLFVHGDVFALGDPSMTAAFAAVVMHPSFEESSRPLWHGATTYLTPFPGTADGVDIFSPDGIVTRAATALAADPAAAAHHLADSQSVRHFLRRAEESRHWSGERPMLPSEVLEAGLLVHPLHHGILDGPIDADGRYATSLRSVIDEVLGRDRAAAGLTRGLATILAPHRDSYLGLSTSITAQDDVLALAVDDAQRYLTIVMSGEAGELAVTEVMATWSASLIDRWGDVLVPAPGGSPTVPDLDMRVSHEMSAHRDLLQLFEGALGEANTRHLDGLGFRFAVIDETERLLRGQVLRQAGYVGGVKGRIASHVLGEVGSAATGQLKDRMIEAGPTPSGDYREQLDLRLERLAITELVGRLPPGDERLMPVPLDPREVEVRVRADGLRGIIGQTVPATELRPFEQWDRAALTAWHDEVRKVLHEDHGLTVREADNWWLSPVLNNLTS